MRTERCILGMARSNRAFVSILFTSVFLLRIPLSVQAQTDHGGTNVTWNNQTVSGVHFNIGTLTINGAVTVATTNALDVTAVTININGALSANGAGYPENTLAVPPLGGGDIGGNNQGGGGGGYGGVGGNGQYYLTDPSIGVGGTNWGNPDITTELDSPDEFGSGGGHAGGSQGGRGGGAIKLVATGTLTVTGQISADGNAGGTQADDGSGGGAGGSIWLDCDTLAGGGSVSAKGGNGQDSMGDGGGGGGGRISVSYSTDNSAIFYFVAGGVGPGNATDGGVGTLRINGADAVPDSPVAALWDHGGYDWILGINQEVSGVHTNVNKFIVTNCTATVASGLKLQVYATNIVIAGNGVLSANQSGTSTTGKGYGSAGGGGYGGAGGAGNLYNAQGGWVWGNPSISDEMEHPDEMGSIGGSGYAGGGAIKLVATDTLQISGSITANGRNGANNNGGGSGGSLWLDCGTLTGNGTVAATGGNSSGTGGAGGGGRIAIYYNTDSSSITPAGSMVAGGTGTAQAGQSGTFWVNTGLAFTHTWMGYDHGGADWILSANTYNLGGTHTGIGTFQVNSGVTGTVACGTMLNVAASVVVIEGKLTADGKGYFSGGAGSPGDGQNGWDNMASGGGGYGGAGGHKTGYTGSLAWGDPDIGDETEHPDEFGGAGGHSNGAGTGGPGGGAIKLTATGAMTINGTISADGLDGWDYNDDGNAGGAGGSIWLDCRTLAGTGTLSAAGGDREPNIDRDQGGGGGGRIAIYYSGDAIGLSTNVNAGLDAPGIANPAVNGTVYVRLRPLGRGAVFSFR